MEKQRNTFCPGFVLYAPELSMATGAGGAASAALPDGTHCQHDMAVGK
ncbi:MAG: hypothetical protein HFH94_16685 [Lachnospiraceae bacterium]|nr:hypothetical protein [uncultured Acetatifactor sp.]MCI9221325.1 hypothetical protein [Lachnospiraceae bacterium]